MNKSGIIKTFCFIYDFSIWDDIINEHATNFYKRYSIYPNIMLASKSTWDKIDKMANFKNPESIKISGPTNIDTEENHTELRSISSFSTDLFSLDFCLDEELGDDYFILAFDEDPTFDGEPYDYGENEEIFVYQRIA